jgi:hypothetical protein
LRSNALDIGPESTFRSRWTQQHPRSSEVSADRDAQSEKPLKP